MAIGDYVEAEPMIRETFEIRKRVLPVDHPDLLYSLNNLTTVLVQEAEASREEVFAKQAIALARRIYGK